MKKCLVVREMGDVKNEAKWRKYRIKNRYEEKTIPFFGTVVQLSYHFHASQEQLGRLHISNKNLVVKTLNMITQRSFLYDNFWLVNTTWNEMQLPMLLTGFDQ